MMIEALALMLAAAPAAAAEPPPAAREARIPFLRYGGVRDFRAVDDDSILLRASGRRWYRAELMPGCTGLRFAHVIGVQTRTGTLDRFGTLIVDGQRCPLQSLVESAPPEDRRR